MERAEPYTEIRMQKIAVREIRQTVEREVRTNRVLQRRPVMVLYSRVPGRERWYVDAVEDNPRLAAAVEVVLRSEEGILDARANPLTGGVVLRYQPGLPSASIEAMIHRAVAFGPMSEAEFSSFRSQEAPANMSFRHLLVAELACTAINLALLGEFCPFVLGAVGLHLLMHRHA